MKHIAIFASGTGSNARKIIEHFENNLSIRVSLIVCNKASAPVLDIAKAHQISHLLIDRPYFYEGKNILKEFAIYSIDFIVLAGFLWLIPEYLVEAFERKIINIHPALLPKYGGKGMYGMNVHRAVHAAGDRESGISIHYVNSRYDEGNLIFQASCQIEATDSPEDIAAKVRHLEHKHFATVTEDLLS